MATETEIITKEPTQDTEPAGMPEGTIITTPEGTPDERIVHDVDKDGNIIGWHKELAE